MDTMIKQIETQLINFIEDMGINESIDSSSTLMQLELDSTEQADFVVFIQTKFGVILEKDTVGNMELSEIVQAIIKEVNEDGRDRNWHYKYFFCKKND